MSTNHTPSGRSSDPGAQPEPDAPSDPGTGSGGARRIGSSGWNASFWLGVVVVTGSVADDDVAPDVVVDEVAPAELVDVVDPVVESGTVVVGVVVVVGSSAVPNSRRQGAAP